MLNQVRINFTQPLAQLVAKLRVHLDLALDLLVTLERPLETVFRVERWIASLIDVCENFSRNNDALDGALCSVDVYQWELTLSVENFFNKKFQKISNPCLGGQSREN